MIPLLQILLVNYTYLLHHTSMKFLILWNASSGCGGALNCVSCTHLIWIYSSLTNTDYSGHSKLPLTTAANTHDWPSLIHNHEPTEWHLGGADLENWNIWFGDEIIRVRCARVIYRCTNTYMHSLPHAYRTVHARIQSLVFSPKAGYGRNQSPVRRPVWLWHTAF